MPPPWRRGTMRREHSARGPAIPMRRLTTILASAIVLLGLLAPPVSAAPLPPLAADDQVVITDLGLLRRVDGELTQTALHPGVTVDQAREATGWELKVAHDLQTTDPPSADELAALRELERA